MLRKSSPLNVQFVHTIAVQLTILRVKPNLIITDRQCTQLDGRFRLNLLLITRIS